MDLISTVMLRSGRELELAPGIAVRHPTVSDILRINGGLMCEDYYWTYVFTVLSDPYDYMVYLDDNQIDYEKVSAFDVFMLRWNDAVKDYVSNKEKYLQFGASPLSLMKDALAFFFGPRKFCISKIADQFVLADADDRSWLVTQDAFNLATHFISLCNCIDREDQIKPATPGAKRVLIDDRRREERKRAKRSIDKEERIERIGEAMSAIDAGVGMVASYDTLPVYRLLATARSVQKRVVVQSILNGIYTGMIKSGGVPDKELRWA